MAHFLNRMRDRFFQGHEVSSNAALTASLSNRQFVHIHFSDTFAAECKHIMHKFPAISSLHLLYPDPVSSHTKLVYPHVFKTNACYFPQNICTNIATRGSPNDIYMFQNNPANRPSTSTNLSEPGDSDPGLSLSDQVGEHQTQMENLLSQFEEKVNKVKRITSEALKLASLHNGE